MISVLDAGLETIKGPTSVFVSEHPSFDVEAGVYAVHVDPPSGQTIRRTVTVAPRKPGVARFNIHDLSGHEELEKSALLGGVEQRPESVGLDGDEYASSWGRLWRRGVSGEWRLVPFTPTEAWHDPDGVRYEFQLPRGAHLLQVGGPHVAHRHVALPFGPLGTVTILPDHDRSGELLVSPRGRDDAAESLLGFMRSGSLDSASQVVKRAEHLLRQKFDDPHAAAIAGYYLLRLRKLERLRDWGPNLAKYFPWLPDGAVIDGWQHIYAGRDGDGDAHFDAARTEFIAAVSRGLPVYTEGLRLLVDGLSLFAGDAQAVAALGTVTRYARATDWTSSTVTFSGTEPGRPDPVPKYGMPPGTAGMVLLHRFELADLVRTGFIAPETRVRFAHDPEVTGLVTDDGILRLDTGKTFRDPDDAARAAAPSGEEPWLHWNDWQITPTKSLATIADDARSASVRARGSDSVARLGLSTRTANALREAGISTVREVIGQGDLGEVAGIGEGSLEEVASSLSASGLRVPIANDAQARAPRPRSRKPSRSAPRSERATGAEAEAVVQLRNAVRKRLIKPMEMVMISRDRIEAVLGEAVDQGRVTARDAQRIVSGLVKRGHQQTTDVMNDLEQLLGRKSGGRTAAARKGAGGAAGRARTKASGARGRAVRTASPARERVERARRRAQVGPSFPITGYDDLHAPQIEARLRHLTPTQLRRVRDYERRNANRKTILKAIDSKLARGRAS